MYMVLQIFFSVTISMTRVGVQLNGVRKKSVLQEREHRQLKGLDKVNLGVLRRVSTQRVGFYSNSDSDCVSSYWPGSGLRALIRLTSPRRISTQEMKKGRIQQ